MTPHEPIATKFSRYDEISLKDNTKADFLGNLEIAVLDMPVVKEKRAGEMQDIFRENLITVTKIISK